MRFSFLCILSLFLLQVNAQTQFGPQQVISTEADLPVAIETGDINGDGTLDVISVARSDNNVAWYENADGLGNFSELQLIAESDENKNLAVGDINNDNDLDILVTASFLDIVFKIDNQDGNGNFSSQTTIANLDGAFDVELGHINSDGFLDVVIGSTSAQLVWLENQGDGTFDDGTLISNFETNGRSLKLVDIDGDGDNDILNSNSGSVIVSWYENLDGEGGFSLVKPIDTASPASSTLSVFGADMDGDIDIDVVVASAGDTAVSWYENLDGQGSFGNAQMISNSTATQILVHVEDLDNDGDNDVLAGSIEPDKIIWFANDGNGNFGPEQIITAAIIFPRDIKTADLDGDGDMDVLSVSQNDNKIAWYENFTILSNESYLLPIINVTPNPVRDSLQVNVTNGVIDQIRLFNLLGEELLNEASSANQIDVSRLVAGIYFLKVTVGDQAFIEKILKR